MESLHNKIMNIKPKGYPKAMDMETAYKIGHRDARHEAAEMALEYESLIEELVEALEWYVKKAEAVINKVKHDR